MQWSPAVPKTYNQRQIDQLNLEAAHAPLAHDKPDVSRYCIGKANAIMELYEGRKVR